MRSTADSQAESPAETARARSVLVPLFVIQFFSWSGLFALWIYAVPVVTHFVFAANQYDSPEYRSGLFWCSLAFAFYAVLGTSLAFVLPWFVERWGHATVHGSAMLVGGAGIASLAVIEHPLLLVPAFTAIGIGWCSIANIPYGMVSEAAPPERISHYMRLFGFSTVIPQTTATFALAFITQRWLGQATNWVMAVGGASMGVAALITFAMRRRLP